MRTFAEKTPAPRRQDNTWTAPSGARSSGAGPMAASGSLGIGYDFAGMPTHSRDQASPIFGKVARSADILSEVGEVPAGDTIDQAAPGPAPAAPAPVAPAPAPAAPGPAAGPARPTSLYQLLTSWTPAANQYGFQLKFRCRSTSGDVRDLQAQAPSLIWRERVTYTRNDFAHRISPPNPTIEPVGGVGFAAANTRILGPDLLEFSTATDTHWMPTAAVRSGDFRAAGPPPPAGFIGPVQPPLPAVMESRQLYQYSPDAGASWHYFAGEFIIRRTLFDDGGALKFRTQKTGVHTVTEPYKP